MAKTSNTVLIIFYLQKINNKLNIKNCHLYHLKNKKNERVFFYLTRKRDDVLIERTDKKLKHYFIILVLV